MDISSNDTARYFLSQNSLFEGFSDHQLDLIISLMEEKTFEKDEIIIDENESSDQIYLIKTGEVEVIKIDAERNTVHHLATLTEGSVIGELVMLDNVPRSASVRALQPCVLYVFSITKLRELGQEQNSYSEIAKKLSSLAEEAKNLAKEIPFFSLLIQNIAKGLGRRIRTTNDAVVDALRKELEQAKARVAMSILIITVVTLQSVYIVVLIFLAGRHYQGIFTSLVSLPLIVVYAVVVIIAMLKTGYPLKMYGLTLDDWRASLKESLLFTALLMLLMMSFKEILILIYPSFAHRPLFEIATGSTPYWEVWSFMLLYILFVPLQELVVRGALQGSFQELLTGRSKVIWAILLSNLLFSLSHFHISIMMGLSVFLPGLFWGWLYSRHRTLIGVTVSHIICGTGFFSLMGAFN